MASPRVRSILHVAQYTVGGPFYGWPNFARKEVLDYIAQRGNDTGRFPKSPPKAPPPAFSFKADATVQSNVERAALVAQGYGGVEVTETVQRPIAQGNLERGHFFPTARSTSTGQGNRQGVS
jgi:hypothetical protein